MLTIYRTSLIFLIREKKQKRLLRINDFSSKVQIIINIFLFGVQSKFFVQNKNVTNQKFFIIKR